MDQVRPEDSPLGTLGDFLGPCPFSRGDLIIDRRPRSGIESARSEVMFSPEAHRNGSEKYFLFCLRKRASGVADASRRGDAIKGLLMHQQRVMQKLGVDVIFMSLRFRGWCKN